MPRSASAVDVDFKMLILGFCCCQVDLRYNKRDLSKMKYVLVLVG